MSDDAKKRMQAIESLEDLGVGFTLATHDLEIRGAGELLGEEQSGQIQEIGFSLYTELLTQAVASLKQGVEPNFDRPLDAGVEINLGRFKSPGTPKPTSAATLAIGGGAGGASEPAASARSAVISPGWTTATPSAGASSRLSSGSSRISFTRPMETTALPAPRA